MSIKYLDMFAGIGGFRSGLDKVGDFECVGYCEIDEKARKSYEAMYNTESEVYYKDAREINVDELPDIDCICGGFPCQSFSIAGRRLGFEDDTRGTLFFEIARIAAVKKPALLFHENVPGLLTHDEGRTFATIISTLDEIGYDVTWTVFNSADFGVPQSRNRLFITGFFRGKCAAEVFMPNRKNSQTLIRRINGGEGRRVYDPQGLSVTLTCGSGGTGLYVIPLPLESVNQTIKQQYHFIDMNRNPKITELARCITCHQNSGIGRHVGERSGVVAIVGEVSLLEDAIGKQIVFESEDKQVPAVILLDKNNGKSYVGYIRKLTPRECWRLQGFTDEQFNKVVSIGMKDTDLYKMAGNAVSVPVISALGEQLKRIYYEGVKN